MSMLILPEILENHSNNGNIRHRGGNLSSFNTAQWASPEDWNNNRDTIERLYIDEDKTLREVMSVMAARYRHKATVKMYKSKITEWGLKKYISADEVAFILRKKMQRDAIKKPYVFRVRNKPVDIAGVVRYTDRKTRQGYKLRLPPSGVPTPPYISCSTPTPTLSPAVLGEDEQERTGTNDNRQPHQATLDHAVQQNSVPDHNRDTAQGLFHLQGHHSTFSGSQIGHHRRLNFQIQGLPAVVALPQVWLLPERLFATITTYFDSCFKTGIWIVNERGQCISKQASHKTSALPIAFFHYCESASTFFLQQSPVKGRQILSKAIALIPELLRAEHPSILENFLDAILILKQRQQMDIAAILHSYFVKMAKIIFPPGHPWSQISWSMTAVSPEQHTALLSQSWKCAADTFGRALGRLSPTSIRCEIDFVRRVYGVDDPTGAETHLRNLLADCERDLGPLDRSSLEILCTLGYRLLEQERYVEAEAVGQDMLQRSHHVTSHLARVDALELSAKTQYHLGRQDLAERNMRDAVEKASDVGERGSPDLLRNMLLLERWLREWGRGPDADELRLEMAGVIGPDDSDA